MHHHNWHEKNKQNVTISEKNGPMVFFVEVKGESVIITWGDVELAGTEKLGFRIIWDHYKKDLFLDWIQDIPVKLMLEGFLREYTLPSDSIVIFFRNTLLSQVT